MEKLKNYKHKTDIGNYVAERFKVNKGVYDFKIFSDQEIIAEEKSVEVRTGRDLEKRIRKVIKNYEENLEVNEPEEVDEIEEMQDAIDELVDKDEEIEEEIEEIEEKIDLSLGDGINTVFKNRKTPIEMQELFKVLDTEIRKINGVNFKTTTLDLVYMINGKNFLRIRPLLKYLFIMTAQEWYVDVVKLIDENEIDDAMVSIKESYELIKKKTSKK